MHIRQLRSLVTLVDSRFNVSRAAKELHLVQPAVSQHLKQLEHEVGTRLFVRQGNRLSGLTDAGEEVLHYARRTLADTGNILAVGRDRVAEEKGVLRIGTTHTQARHVLPPVIRRFSTLFPEVELQIHQGVPDQLADMAAHDTVDLAISTEALDKRPALKAIPCFRWNRCLIAPPHHPVASKRPISLELLSAYPLITYTIGFTGHRGFQDSFARVGLQPRVVLSAADSEVIKTYVREGLGLGIMSCLAYEEGRDGDLAMRGLSHLFPWEVTKIAFSREKHLRRFQEEFIEIFQAETGYMARGKQGEKVTEE